MILCLDIGNTQIYGGLFEGGKKVMQFRKAGVPKGSSDEYGLFLRSVLRENGAEPVKLRGISLCSVVPDVLHSMGSALTKYFDARPFILQSGVRTGLKVLYRNPLEVGSDRIANAIAATHLYPQKNIIIVDFGTATTFCAISKNKEYLGGTILPGLRISMEALEERTSKLPPVEILQAQNTLGRSTVESIQSGLYFGHLGAVKEVCAGLSADCFSEEPPLVIGTGGFSSLYTEAGVFHHHERDLVLKGLLLAYQMNAQREEFYENPNAKV